MATFNRKKSKLITVANRGRVYTSRGYVMGPITTPYREELDTIILQVSRFNLDVYEVLNNGEKLKLNIHNFNLDNNKPAEVIPTNPDRDRMKAEEEVSQITSPDQAISKTMNRKDRKRLELERYERSRQLKNETVGNSKSNETKSDTTVVEETEAVESTESK